jgi:uncharacterized protein YuzE
MTDTIIYSVTEKDNIERQGDIMKITLDKKADAMYIYLQEKKVSKTKQITDDTIVDMDKNGNVIGIELLFVSKRIPLESLSNLDIKQLV